MEKSRKTIRIQDGPFDYEEYVRIETDVNKEKFDRTSFSWDEFASIVENFRSRSMAGGRQPFALCQGVRNGAEIHFLSRELGFRVVGTDISDTILNIRDGVMMDFHDCPKLWKGKVDFLYSNSWDQSYDVPSCIAHWGSLLSERGVLYLQHTPNHFKDTGLSVKDLERILASAGIQCDETLAVSRPSAVIIFLRRIKKLFARFAGRSLPMSRSMPDTFILVGRKAVKTAQQTLTSPNG